MSDEEKARVLSGDHHHHHHHHHQPPEQYPAPQYGTFQGVSNYPPEPQPAIGFPQPVPPPGAVEHSAHSTPQYYAHGYQAVPPGYAVAEGRPVRERRLPCCGLGCGWCLIGNFFRLVGWGDYGDGIRFGHFMGPLNIN